VYNRLSPICRHTYRVIGLVSVLSLCLASSSDALVRPSRETERAATWRKLYDQFPEAWKSRAVVVVREVSDREMNRLVREREEGESRDSDDNEVQGFFEYSGPREDVPTIVLRESLQLEDASFVFTHEYGHFIWEEKLSEQERDDYFQIWNRQRRNRRLVSQYANDSVAEGFAEVFAHYLRKPARLHKRDSLSEQFLEDWMEDHKPEPRRESK
jgi:hypothetical protein